MIAEAMKKTTLTMMSMVALVAVGMPGEEQPDHASDRNSAQPLAQKHTVVHRNEDRAKFIEGPGLVAFEDGELLAVVPVIPQ